MSALKILRPDKIVDSIYDIKLDFLKEQGIKAIIADLDNTLVPWRSSEVKDEQLQWVGKARSFGLRVAIVSNNTYSRVDDVSSKLGVIALSGAFKPRRSPFRLIASHFSLQPAEIAVVGDQLFTDILGGNRCGMYTILVKPMSKQEIIGTKFMRVVEKIFLRNML
ncbi:MAG: YqeG family HAD IIIA-type phosphatase [Dethiobacter sp.]|nr:YqeG family HAD IIIA-type phosphatase [Dethiobacter sp.]MBS3989884.1 YqeG family HAD IIIA-type phosphatase [Dethiobacter sp.]